MPRSLPLLTSNGLLDAPIISKIHVPEVIEQIMQLGAALVISLSGGKDSQAMLAVLLQEYKQRRWKGPLIAVHADLGRAEWKQSLPHCQKMASQAGIELVIVRRVKGNGDLVNRFHERMVKLKGKNIPFWSSKKNRFCTSDMKTSPINKVLRRYSLVVSAEGLRAEESTDRAKKNPISIREKITAERLKNLKPEEALAQRKINQRVGLTWYPILEWKIEQVWNACGTSTRELEHRRSLYNEGREEEALAGWPAHPLYVYGNERVSCVLCIFASKSDLRNGRRLRPELYQEYTQLEEESGFTFKSKQSLSQLTTG